MADIYSRFQKLSLGNGVPVHHLHLPDAKRQYVCFLLHAGSYHSQDYPGLGHFTEHIVANSAGCKKLQKEIAEEGGSLHGGGGATYGFGTAYGFYLPAGHAWIPSLIERFKDYVFANPLNHGIEFEKNPFLAERAERFPNLEETSKKFLRYYGVENIWATPDIAFGTPESIKNITHADVERLYRSQYTVANLSIIGVGPLVWADFQKLLDTAGWNTLPMAGQRFAPAAPLEQVPGPRLGRFALAVPRINNTELFAVAHLPRTFHDGTLRITSTIIRRYFHELLREEKGIVYAVRAVWGSSRVTYGWLNIACQGISPQRTGEFWLLYQKACEDICNPAILTADYIEKCRRHALNRFLSAEETSEDIHNSSIHFLTQNSRIHTDAEQLAEIESASHDQIRTAIAALCSPASYTELHLPEGTSAPAGLPVYELHATAEAFRTGQVPSPKS